MSAVLHWPGWDWLMVFACGVGAAACLLFVVGFQRESRGAWRTTPFGRFLMMRKALLACLFVLILVNRAVTGQVVMRDAWPGQSLVTSLLFTAFCLHTFLPYRFVIEAQHERMARERREQERS